MKPRTEGRRRSRPASLSRCTGRRPETGPHNRSRQNAPCDQPHGVALAPAGASRVRHPRAARLQHAAVGWPPLPVAPRTSIPGPPPPPHGRAHQDPDHPPEGRAAGGQGGAGSNPVVPTSVYAGRRPFSHTWEGVLFLARDAGGRVVVARPLWGWLAVGWKPVGAREESRLRASRRCWMWSRGGRSCSSQALRSFHFWAWVRV